MNLALRHFFNMKSNVTELLENCDIFINTQNALCVSEDFERMQFGFILIIKICI